MEVSRILGTKQGAPEWGREGSRREVCREPGVSRSLGPSSSPALPRPVESSGQEAASPLPNDLVTGYQSLGTRQGNQPAGHEQPRNAWLSLGQRRSAWPETQPCSAGAYAFWTESQLPHGDHHVALSWPEHAGLGASEVSPDCGVGHSKPNRASACTDLEQRTGVSFLGGPKRL